METGCDTAGAGSRVLERTHCVAGGTASQGYIACKCNGRDIYTVTHCGMQEWSEEDSIPEVTGGWSGLERLNTDW